MTGSAKPLSAYFYDWQSHVFGFGYGTGEEHTIPALRTFLEGCQGEPESSYDYRALESVLTPTVAWLLMSTLGNADIIEYGTSPRFGWLTPNGVALRNFMLSHSNEELIGFTERDEEYHPCSPGYCNCDDGQCDNPFWRRS